MKFSLREGLCTDCATILAIDNKHSPVYRKAQSYERLLGEKGLLMVAAEAQKIIGFAACSRVLDEATLLNIAVVPQLRGRGVAQALLKAVMQGLANSHVKRLYLEVRKSNHPAQSLYFAAGFSCDGERAHYYPRDDDGVRETAILMSRQLGSDDADT